MSGDDVDDEEFTITIKYDIFAVPEVDSNMDLKKVQAQVRLLLWSLSLISGNTI